jgi:hypothetical protein
MTISDMLRGLAVSELMLACGFLIISTWNTRTYKQRPPYVAPLVYSYLMLCVVGVIEIFMAIGGPMTWRTPIVFIAATFAVISCMRMWRYVRRYQ